MCFDPEGIEAVVRVWTLPFSRFRNLPFQTEIMSTDSYLSVIICWHIRMTPSPPPLMLFVFMICLLLGHVVFPQQGEDHRQPDARGVRGASRRSRGTRPSRAPLGQLKDSWPPWCNARRPRIQNLTVFRSLSGRAKGEPKNCCYENGTDHRSISEPNSRRLLTYEWGYKRDQCHSAKCLGNCATD
jgi:hypothetical protein